MENHLPFDPDFSSEAKADHIQFSLSKEQVFAIGMALGVATSLVYLALLT